jgi:hypothetical protein
MPRKSEFVGGPQSFSGWIAAQARNRRAELTKKRKQRLVVALEKIATNVGEQT